MARETIPARFPQRYIEKLKATAARREIPDQSTSGLYLIVQPSGARSWAIRYRANGKAVKLTIGRCDATERPDRSDEDLKLGTATQLLTVTEARRLSERLLRAVANGEDPINERKDTSAGKFTAEFWLNEFVKTARTKGFKKNGGPVKKSTGDEYERIINVNIMPEWKKVKDIRNLTFRDVEALLDCVTKPAMRRATFAVLSIFFRWKPVLRLIGKNLVEMVDAPAKAASRDRTLTNQEIRWFWQASGEIGAPFGPLTRLLLLTGQRRDEIAKLQWSEIHELDGEAAAIVLESVRTKNGNAHVVCLASSAVETIKSLLRVFNAKGKKSAWCFPTVGGDAHYSGFSNGKRALDKKMLEIAKRDDPTIERIQDWRLHDLRRTCATGLAALNIKQEVTEAILNHKSGKTSGIAGVYNRYEYQGEKREALELWAARVNAISGSNVVVLSEKRA